MNQSVKMAGIAVVGAGIGFAVGFKVAERRLGAEFDKRLEEETREMREFYSSVKQKYETPEEAVAALIPEKKEPEDPRVPNSRTQYNKIVKETYVDIPDPSEAEIEKAEQARNVFDDKARNPDVPYLISQEEFMANDPGYEQATLTYYEKGGVLTDQRDDVIDNPKDVLVPDFATRFGYESSDDNTVHVRNEKLQMDFEVCRSERSYEEDVLGQTDDPVSPHRKV